MSHSDPASPDDAHRPGQWTSRVRGAISGLPSAPFFLGVVLGFLGCAVAGRVVSRQPMLEGFVRFFGPIQPQRNFYPTASELISHVRNTVPRGKTPVIVGGASYFRGTGQNPGELWTRELQRRLGDRYVVINFAIDQAPFTAFAMTAFQCLAHEYPDAIYVANASPLSSEPLDGGTTYRYLFWDAYYKGLLPSSLADSQPIRDLAREERRGSAGLELHLGKWLDGLAYACDLWTFIGYNYFFTVWSNEHARAPFHARHYREPADPNIGLIQANYRNDANYARHSEERGRSASRERFLQGPDGQWRPDAQAWQALAEEWRTSIPPELHARCFVVYLRGNPYFMQTLTDEEWRRTERQYQLGQQNLEPLGYHVVQLRREDFNADDFLDGGHYVASGGAKIARAVAEKIQQVRK